VPPFYGQYSLQPVRTDLSLNADTLFPDLNNIPQFPAPFSMDSTNRTAYTFQWNGNVQHSFGANYLVEVAYTGSRSYNEHKRYNINQAQPGTTPIVTRVPYPAFQSAILYSSDAGWARFNGLSLRLDKRYSGGMFFLATTSCRRTPTTARARSNRTTPRLPGTPTPTRATRATTSGTDRRSASATSCRSGRASGISRAAARRLHLRRLAGAGESSGWAAGSRSR
jgi:hypothetical protein